LTTPSSVLILSSLVSASRVGGGYQAATLTALGFDPILAPTVLFGRHPGLGAPGGGAVGDALFEDLLGGIAASGVFADLSAVICGYFASAGQVEIAARTVDAIRTVNPGVWLVVDPIMGDEGTGLYVKSETALALRGDLIGRADLVAPNGWELARLSGMDVVDPHSAVRAARRLGRPVLASSIVAAGLIGVVFVDDQAAWFATHTRLPAAPKGTGDLLTARFVAETLAGAPPRDALAISVRVVAEAVGSAPMEVHLEALS
jgi:pyridoxine kinase